MARVSYTNHLVRYFPALADEDVDAPDVRALVRELDARHPGLAGYLVDERGRLRQHVNIFVGGTPLRDRMSLADALAHDVRVHIAQALSGG